MNVEEAIAIVDKILGSDGLSDLQEDIFRQVWTKAKYPDIAETLGYDANYIKDLGAKIWKQLSLSLDEKVTKSNIQSVLRRWQQTHGALDRQPIPSQNAEQPRTQQSIDWGGYRSTSTLIGRRQSLDILASWLEESGGQLIAILGIAGIGKTILAAHLAESVAEQFEHIIWRSLKHPLSPTELLQNLLATLQIDSEDSGETSLEGYITLLLRHLRDRRCLIILDGAESLMASRRLTRDYQAGYEDYALIFQAIGSTPHRSVVLLTCREKPKSWDILEQNYSSVRSLSVDALNAEEVQQLVRQKGELVGTSDDWRNLTEQYGGNPLALQIVSSNILDFFEGNVSAFLAEGQIVFEGLSAFLQQQWSALTIGEQWVLNYLAMRREYVSFNDLKSDSQDSSLQRRLTDALAALCQRSLVERQPQDGLVTFGLQASVLEYVTVHLIDTLSQEVSTHQLRLLHQLPLLKIQSPKYLQTSQQQFLLQPILDKLKDVFPNVIELEQHLLTLLHQLQRTLGNPSYAAGNIINLLIQLGRPLADQDFSGLPLWEVNLAAIPLHDLNLNRCDLSRTNFSSAFGGVISVAINPCESSFATGHEDGLITVWDIHHGYELQSFKGHKGWVWSLSWTPDGNQLISGSEDRTLRIWDVEAGSCCQVLTGHNERIWSVVSYDNTIAMSSSSDQTIKVWDIQQGKCLRTLTGDQGDITALAVVNSTAILSGGTNQILRLWNWETEEPLETWHSQQGAIWAIAYCEATELIYSGGDGGIVEVWERGNPNPVHSLGKESARIWSLALSPDARYLLVGGDSHRVVQWDLQDLRIVQTMTDYPERIWSIDYSASGDRAITASEDNRIQLWNIHQGQPLLTLSSYSNWACDVVILETRSPLIASAYGDGNLYVWDAETETPIRTLQGHQQSTWALANHLSGTRLVSGGKDHSLRIWDIDSGQCEMVLRGHRRQVWSVAWSRDGQTIASGSSDRTVKLWDATSSECLATLIGHQSRVWSVAWSPDSQTLASGSGDRTIKLWDRATGACRTTLEGHQSQILAIAFHPSENLLASVGGDSTCKLWDLDPQDCQTIPVPSTMIWTVAWSPDGQYLAVGSDDGQIHLWNHRHQDWENTLSTKAGCIWAIAFSSDGSQLWSGSQDGTTRLWDIATQACRHRLQPKRLYEGLQLIDAQGLTAAQLQNLARLGAKS